jgi:hypothetical protein
MERLFATIAFVLIFILSSMPISAANNLWYVATTGSDTTGDGSIESPFATIQHGIDVTSNNDTVVVLEGRYTGAGNRNLNFFGKAITVRSRDPNDNLIMRSTIIDAEGQGVVVRFINDESSYSVFEGFTLFPGDTSIPMRGSPGLFEFSVKARPTTRRLRVGGDADSATEEPAFCQTEEESILAPLLTTVQTEPPYGGRAWDGNNPFHQPAATTDYLMVAVTPTPMVRSLWPIRRSLS